MPNGMKSLKIPKGQSESVYRRRTENTMATNMGNIGTIFRNATMHPHINK